MSSRSSCSTRRIGAEARRRHVLAWRTCLDNRRLHGFQSGMACAAAEPRYSRVDGPWNPAEAAASQLEQSSFRSMYAAARTGSVDWKRVGLSLCTDEPEGRSRGRFSAELDASIGRSLFRVSTVSVPTLTIPNSPFTKCVVSSRVHCQGFNRAPFRAGSEREEHPSTSTRDLTSRGNNWF